MNNKQNTPLARTKGLVVRKLKNEVLVYDIDSRQAHCLNVTAAKVWEQCDGQRTVNDLSVLLQQDEETIWLALTQLSERNLLDQPLIRPHKNIRMDRRQVMKAAGAAALITVPMISTIIAPSAAQASTCLASGNTCSLSAECCSGLCSLNQCV